MGELAVQRTPLDHRRGPDEAPVVLVAYADFQCPHCAHAAGMLRALLERFGSRLQVIHRHFPLTDVHPHAQLAAEAAEAAAAQGKFWPMHDRLYAAQDRLGERDLLRHAAELDLDVDLLGAHLVQRVFAPRVRADWLNGQRSGVRGTPTLFVNDRRVEGVRGRDALADVIRAAMPGRG
jgi:NhaA family Na+:H+ antiporter